MYKKALRTVWKTFSPSQRKMAERTLQSNSRILNIMFRGHEIRGRDRHSWLIDATKNIADLQELCEKDRGQSVHSLCRDIAAILPDLSRCELAECADYDTLSADSNQRCAVKPFSKLLSNSCNHVSLSPTDKTRPTSPDLSRTHTLYRFQTRRPVFGRSPQHRIFPGFNCSQSSNQHEEARSGPLQHLWGLAPTYRRFPCRTCSVCTFPDGSCLYTNWQTRTSRVFDWRVSGSPRGFSAEGDGW